MMRSRQRGFTLIELMIVVAIIGILSSIAIPTFVVYLYKGQRSEARIAMAKLLTDLRVHHVTKGSLPASTRLMPDTPACDTGTGKTNSTRVSDWYTGDDDWEALGFYINEPGYFQYSWTRDITDPATGFASAVSNVDCDGVMGYLVVDVSIASGNFVPTTSQDLNE